MSAEQNKDLVRRYFEAISGKDKPASVVDEYVGAEDEALKQHIRDAERAFPRYELIAEDLIAEGDKVVVRSRLRATHNGPYGPIPASGRRVDLPVGLIYRIANGKIVEHWMYLDNMALMQQLGAMPAPEA